MNKGLVPIHVFILCTLLSFLLLVSFPRFSSSAAARDIGPQGTTQELSIDDGTAECAAGTPANLGGKDFGWANKLTPSSYPATLRSITIGFDRNVIGREVRQDA